MPGFLAWGRTWDFFLNFSQSLGVLSSGLLRGELQPWKQSCREAFQWSLMLYLTPAEEKTLNRELLLTFGFASEALLSRQCLMMGE